MTTIYILLPALIIRADSYNHNGSAPERDPRLLYIPCGQPAGFSIPAAVHPGGGRQHSLT